MKHHEKKNCVYKDLNNISTILTYIFFHLHGPPFISVFGLNYITQNSMHNTVAAWTHIP